MNSSPLTRLAGVVALLAVLAGGCAEATNERASGWRPENDVAAELETAERRVADRVTVEARILELAPIDPELATCVTDELIDARGEGAPSVIVDPETDAGREVEPLQLAIVGCGVDGAATDLWIPALAVELRTHGRLLDCVSEAARPWVAERFAEVLIDPPNDDDFTDEQSVVGEAAELNPLVDEAWFAGAVDRCDAGGAVMAAIATVHPQVGEDARTPRRWLCAAGKAPDGTFDDAVDPAVVESEPRAAGLESKIAPFFQDCE